MGEPGDTTYTEAMKHVVRLLDEALDLLHGEVDDPNVMVNLELARLNVQDEIARSR